jgi:hypothetical protein
VEHGGNPEQDKARRRLLEEGAGSYLKAANAVVTYQQEVQKKCRKVMERYIGDYGSALKVKLERTMIEDHAWPKFDAWEGDWTSLGVHVVRRDIAGIRWWEAYCTLVWQSEDPEFCCYVDEWFPTRKMATDLCHRFKRLNPLVEVSDKEVGIALALKAEEAPDFEERLEDLFQKWIRLWKKTGGLSAAFKA